MLVVNNARTLDWDQDRVKDREVRSCLLFRDPSSPVASFSRGWYNVNYD